MFIGANAVIAGSIIIEDNVLIAACSLVNTNATSNSVMLGVPAIKVSEKKFGGLHFKMKLVVISSAPIVQKEGEKLSICTLRKGNAIMG